MEEQSESLDTPKWLRRLQANSWEAELLISGGAIFSLVKSSDFITAAGITFKENYPFPGLDQTLVWLTLAISWLTIGFIIHLFFRGYWVALVCLSNAIPIGVVPNAPPVSKNDKNIGKAYNLSQHIIRIDKFSGLIFFSSIIFSLFAVGTLVHAAVTFVLASLLDPIPFLSWFIIGLFILHYVDFVSAGVLLRSKALGRFYRPFRVIGSYLSLGFIYYAPLQILVTKYGRVELSFFILLLSILSVIVSYESLRTVLRRPDYFARHAYQASSNSYPYRDGFYLDKVEERVDWIAIETDLVTANHLKVFIPYRPAYDEAIERAKANAFDKIVRIEINTIPIDSLTWYNYKIKRTNQTGIITYIPIAHLPKGKNEITLFIDGEYLTQRFPFVTVPFWKE